MQSPLSRYPFQPLGEGVFFFVTDNGNYFTVEIIRNVRNFNDNELLCNGGNVFEISFNQSIYDKKQDQDATDTLLHIITINILASGDTAIFYFVCDSSDSLHRGAARSRLFDLWFISIQKFTPGLRKYNFRIPADEDNGYYFVCMLIFENHPKHDEYIKEFELSLHKNFSKR